MAWRNVPIADDRALAASPRWDGKAGRLEVWYATFTDHRTGDGGWIHCEVVAPTSGNAPWGHGWLAWFREESPPEMARFGPTPVRVRTRSLRSHDELWFDTADATVGPQLLRGRAGSFRWELVWEDPSPPLWTFPRIAWTRQVLPGAQVVVAPTANFRGVVELAEQRLHIDATGALAHIYGHGNADRWAWLHADLTGDRHSHDHSGVLEIVTAVSRTPGLSALPPVAFVRLRLRGRDWPTIGLPAIRLHSRLGLPDWSVSGAIGRRRIRVSVHQPPDQTISVAYTDPDGAPATCHNSERADAEITIEQRVGGRWRTEYAWSLQRRAHAELGVRDAPKPAALAGSRAEYPERTNHP